MVEVPWPSIHQLNRIKASVDNPVKVPLIEDYTFKDMAYLDTPQAKPMFDSQADIIINNSCKGIVDVGCRHGPIVEILYEKDYTNFKYMGFDTSIEPIQLANDKWCSYDNIEFKNASWWNEDTFTVDFDVDIVIFSGVLLYREDHFDFFKWVINYYDAKKAIIQEPYHEQTHWDKRLILNTITKDLHKYFQEYKIKSELLDLELFAGRRLILDITI